VENFILTIVPEKLGLGWLQVRKRVPEMKLAWNILRIEVMRGWRRKEDY